MSKEDIKIMKAIRKALSEGKDVEVRNGPDGKLKLIASKKETLNVD